MLVAKSPEITASYTYIAAVRRVIDGDSVDVTLDLGFALHLDVKLHLDSVVAPDKATADGQRTVAWMKRRVRPGELIEVRVTDWVREGGFITAAVTLSDGTDLNDEIVKAGFASTTRISA